MKQIEKEHIKMKSMYFASIAHELRTPLNSILPMSTRLEEKYKNDPHTLKIIKSN